MTDKVTENKCSSGDNNLVKAYCQQCKKYICTDCHVSQHLDHDSQVIDLAEKATRCLIEYQNLSRAIKLISDRKKFYVNGQPIINAINGLRTKMTDARMNLEKDIDKSLDNIISYLPNGPLVRDLIKKKREFEGEPDDELSKLNDKLEIVCSDLLEQILQEQYVSADKLLSPDLITKYENDIKVLIKVTAGDSDYAEELSKLNDTSVHYSYDPMKIMGMVRFDNTINKPERIFQFNREENMVMIYNMRSGKIVPTKLNQGFILPFRFVSVEAANNVYLIGGDNDNGFFLKSLYFYEEIRQVMIPLSNMAIPRSRHSAVSLGSSFVVIGGENNEGPLSNCEQYDTKENAWKHLPSLEIKRCNHSSCGLNTWIYAGFGWNNVYLNSIERLNLQEPRKWELLSFEKYTPLQNLQAPGMIPIKFNSILIFGGYKEDEKLTDDSFVLNVENNGISKMKEIPKEESFISSEIKNVLDVIYCFGYKGGDIYKYDVNRDNWELIKQNEIPI